MAKVSANVMVVEDQSVIATWLQLRLERLGYNVLDTAADADEAIAKAGALMPDLVLMDVNLSGGSDGITAATEIRGRHGIPVVLVTGSVDDTTLRRAREAAVDGFIRKPFDERQLHTAIQTALHKRRLEQAQAEPGDAATSAQAVDWRVRALLHELNNELAVAMAILDLMHEGHQLPAVPRDQVRTALGRLTAAAGVTTRLQRAIQAPSPPGAAAPSVPAPEPETPAERTSAPQPMPTVPSGDATATPPIRREPVGVA